MQRSYTINEEINKSSNYSAVLHDRHIHCAADAAGGICLGFVLVPLMQFDRINPEHHTCLATLADLRAPKILFTRVNLEQMFLTPSNPSNFICNSETDAQTEV